MTSRHGRGSPRGLGQRHRPVGLRLILGHQGPLQSLSANSVIADSNASANVLYVEITDTPATVLWADKGALGRTRRPAPTAPSPW